jgi:hypothetical protein
VHDALDSHAASWRHLALACVADRPGRPARCAFTEGKESRASASCPRGGHKEVPRCARGPRPQRPFCVCCATLLTCPRCAGVACRAGRPRSNSDRGSAQPPPPWANREPSPPLFAQNYDDFVPKSLAPLFDHVLAFQRYVLSHPAAAGFSKPRLEVFSSTLTGRSSSPMAVGPRALILLRRPQERGNVPDRAHSVHKRA